MGTLLDIALIGAGKIARWHLPVLCQLPGVRATEQASLSPMRPPPRVEPAG